MNRRKAKKNIKKKHNIRKYPEPIPPRYVDLLYTELKKAIADEIDRAILFRQGAAN